MGKTNIYGDARDVYLQAHPSASTWQYGFRTKIDLTESNELGQKDLSTTASLLPILYGVNSPKPAVYKKATSSYAVTSFADSGTTVPNTWKKIKKVMMRAAVSSGRGKVVSVPFKGAKYTWIMNADVYAKISADFGGLGIADAINSLVAAKDQIWGANGKSSKPPRAKKFDSSANATLSTFYDETKTLPTGWEPAGAGGYQL